MPSDVCVCVRMYTEDTDDATRRVEAAAGDTLCKRCGLSYTESENTQSACMVHTVRFRVEAKLGRA